MINLLPATIKQDRRFGRSNITLLSYSISIIAIGILSIGVILFNMQYVRSDENRLRSDMQSHDAQTAALEAKQKDVDKIAAQLKTIDKLYSGEVKFSELIPTIASLLPNGTVLNSLTLTNGKTSPLQLDVDLESQNLAAVFQQNLVNSNLFDAADISAIITKGVSASKVGKSYPFGATLTANFKGAAAPKPVAKVVTP